MTEIQQKIFAQLKALGIIDENGVMQASYMKFTSDGLMDLNVDKLTENTIAIAHNSVQNGDLMCDPDVRIWIHADHADAEALSYQNDYVGVYQEVYSSPGKFFPKLKNDLNIFLADWLQTMIEVQEYKLAETKTDDDED